MKAIAPPLPGGTAVQGKHSYRGRALRRLLLGETKRILSALKASTRHRLSHDSKASVALSVIVE